MRSKKEIFKATLKRIFSREKAKRAKVEKRQRMVAENAINLYIAKEYKNADVVLRE